MSKSVADESSLEALLARCTRSASKLELRDSYLTTDRPYVEWQAKGYVDGAEAYEAWIDIARSVVDRGVTVRRTRIISEPISQYIRFEHAVTDSVNIAAGEMIRWLPRHKTSDLLLPANDLWIFDDQTIRFIYFSGESELVGRELIDDTTVVKQCVSAFELVWERGTDHRNYQPT